MQPLLLEEDNSFLDISIISRISHQIHGHIWLLSGRISIVVFPNALLFWETQKQYIRKELLKENGGDGSEHDTQISYSTNRTRALDC